MNTASWDPRLDLVTTSLATASDMAERERRLKLVDDWYARWPEAAKYRKKT